MPHLRRIVNILGFIKLYKDYDGLLYFKLGNIDKLIPLGRHHSDK